jgi:hypothetical protein
VRHTNNNLNDEFSRDATNDTTIEDNSFEQEVTQVPKPKMRVIRKETRDVWTKEEEKE